MSNKEILENIKKLSKQEKRNFSYDNLVGIMSKLETNEIIELSNIIGYPVFARLCMGALKHKNDLDLIAIYRKTLNKKSI